MHRYITLILLYLPLYLGCAQSSDEDTLKPKVLIDAQKMVEFLLKNDFENLASYTHPQEIKIWGDKRAYIKAMRKSAKRMKKEGTIVHSISVSDPSKEVRCNGEIQCVLKQVTKITYFGDTPSEIKSNLVGTSSDNGKTWLFFNAHRKTIDQIRQEFPSICDSLPMTN